MAETSKNKIYYNDNENSVADVLADMKKMAESTDEAIEKSKYDDTQIKKDISNIQKEQTTQNTDISNIKKEQETQNTNIEENNSKIVELQTEKAKLETELKEIQEDFYQASIRGQASGKYIHVEDSSGARCKIGISGNSEQETRSGKNFLELMEGTYSNNGVTAVVKDGVVTLNGTATAISFVGINLLKSLELTNNKTYHLSAFNEKTAGDGTNYCSLRINQDNIQVLFNKTNANGSITTNLKISYITIRTQTGITYNNFVVKPQLEIGNGTDTWEQGGISPSPDYPSQVKAVGDNVNLFDVTQMKQTIPVGTSEYIYLTKKPNTKYTLSTSLPLAGNNTADIFLISGHTTAATTTDNGAWKGNSRTITCDSNGYLTIAYRKQNVSSWTDLTSYKYKLVEGTEVGEYSQCGQGSVKVTKCNKNLINKNLLTNYQILEDTGKLLSNNTRLITPFIYLKKGTYSLSCNLSRFAYAIYNSDKSFNSFVTWKAFPNQIILNSDCYIKIEFIINPTGSKQVSIKDITYLQLEKGNTTDYEEHEEQSYIMPVQSEMLEDDYFDWDNEEEVHTWNKLVLNGTEEFNSWTGNAPSGYKVFYSRILTNAINSQGDLKCNALKYIENPWESGKNAIGLQRIFKELYISIESKYASTLEEFKTYLKSQYDAGTPVVIYYKLVTPTKLAFTEEQKAVAKELNNARTYKNVTNITTDSKAIIDLDYAKDLDRLTEYSTEEQVIGKWIDGKTLYRKVVHVDSLPQNINTKYQYPHNINNLEELVKSIGIANRASDREKYQFPNANTELWIDNTYIWLRTANDRSLYSAEIILEYTKTTD